MLSYFFGTGLGRERDEQDRSEDRDEQDECDESEEHDERIVTTAVTIQPKLSRCKHNIFWNTFSQELAFRGLPSNVPKYAQKTCSKLAKEYPDHEEAEMFIRAQFVMNVEDMDYTLSGVVMGFKDLVNPRHAAAFKQYHQDCKERIAMLLRSVQRELQEIYTLSVETMSPLAQFVRNGGDCSELVQNAVAIECLHWPALPEVLSKVRPLTKYMKDRIRFFKDQVWQSETQDGR